MSPGRETGARSAQSADQTRRRLWSSATNHGLDDQQRKPIDECADYLLNHTPYLRYDQYLAAGYPISTSVIEGACRYLVEDRMGITGAVWGLASAEAVLRLRAIIACGDIDECWKFHERAEYQGNHANLCAARKVPALVMPAGRPSRPALRLVS